MKRLVRLLSLMLLFWTATSHAQNTEFTVMQLNVWMEAGMVDGAYNALVEEIAAHEPDILTLSEGDFSGKHFFSKLSRDLLEKKGVQYYTTDSYDSGILSKFPLLEAGLVPECPQINRALVSVGTRKLAVYAGHLDYLYYACYNAKGYDGYTWEHTGIFPKDSEEILSVNEMSQRDEQLKAFLASAQEDLSKGNLAIFAGDFNEPSHLDWGDSTKNLFDHHGFTVPWTVSTGLYEKGYKDAFRVVFPDPVTHPGFTFPSDNKDKDISSLTWAPAVDERERIDFIYFHDNGTLVPTEAKVWGPEESIVRNDDLFLLPQGGWPSDHKGVMVRFSIKNPAPAYMRWRPQPAQHHLTPDKKVARKSPYKGAKNYGKSIAVFGGSLSVNAESDAAKQLWADLLNAEVTSYGVGGAGFSADQGYSIQRQVDTAGVYDVYILWASTNDYTNSRECGSWTDYTAFDNYDPERLHTQCGGINYCIRKLLEKNPRAEIYFLTSLRFFGSDAGHNPFSDQPNHTGKNFAAYIEAQKACCAYYGIPVLDQFQLQEINEFNVDQYYLGDRLHMNEDGYRRIAPVQARFIANGH